MKMFFFHRQLERKGQEEEHHWDWPSETPEGHLPQIQVRRSNVKPSLGSRTYKWLNLQQLRI